MSDDSSVSDMRDLPHASVPEMVRDIAALLRPSSGKALAYAVLGIVSSGVELVTLALMLPLIYTLTGAPLPVEFSLPLLADLLAALQPLEQNARILVVGVLLIALSFVRGAAGYWLTRLGSILRLEVEHRQRLGFMQLLLDLDLVYLGKFKSGHLQQMLGLFTAQAAMVVVCLVMAIAPAMLLFVYGLGAVVAAPKLALVSIFCLGAVAWLLSVLVRDVTRRARVVANANLEVGQQGLEILQGLRLIRSFGREKGMLDVYDRAVLLAKQRAIEVDTAKAAVTPINSAAPMIILGLLLILAAVWSPETGTDWSHEALIFLAVLSRVAAPASLLNQLRSDIAAALPNYQILLGFSKIARRARRRDDGLDVAKLDGAVECVGVEFRYRPDKAPIFENLNLVIEAGKTTAVVGSSGAGKSTLVNLLAGLYQPTSGEVRAGRINLADVNTQTLRRRIAIVSQDVFLFNDTILENIRFGRPGASDAECIEAARRAYAADFVEELPRGFATTVGDRGMHLSGGQIQRIAIARAFVANPDILIFDEATSALDSISERRIQKAISELHGKCTVIVIAHRLSTVREADRIIVLDRGRVAESGTHEELLALGGSYRAFLQTAEQLEREI